MKRFSVLAVLIAIIISVITMFHKSTHYTEVKETDYGSQEITRDGKPTGIESSFYCDTDRGLIIEILFATTYSNNLVMAMMVAMDRALN